MSVLARDGAKRSIIPLMDRSRLALGRQVGGAVSSVLCRAWIARAVGSGVPPRLSVVHTPPARRRPLPVGASNGSERLFSRCRERADRRSCSWHHLCNRQRSTGPWLIEGDREGPSGKALQSGLILGKSPFDELAFQRQKPGTQEPAVAADVVMMGTKACQVCPSSSGASKLRRSGRTFGRTETVRLSAGRRRPGTTVQGAQRVQDLVDRYRLLEAGRCAHRRARSDRVRVGRP